MDGLKRAYTYRLDEERLTFHYIPGGRLQAYVGRTNPHSGEYEPLFARVDEWNVVMTTRAEVHTYAHALLRNDEFRAEIEDERRWADQS